MLCFVCLIENRAQPNKAITHAQGTAVCREHINTVTELINSLLQLRDMAELLRATLTAQQK